ncbi:alpha/beta hydrolase [Variovorax sp. Sphag1AA]|uniref:alpha/beta hydrolase n=1 Tax=Variovorax sp. Sphag1AA TaxID=2587027 RepID=UPI0016150C2D|nr:alpha/beta hydrolase [Variovorax sp. Sphag1AA]MBB3179243.1 arylformamidase [Variovorax sp. Sphag1AA]
MPSYDPAWLDRMYNNRVLVPEHPAYFERWAAQSAVLRDALPSHIDLRYGEGPNETLDVFPAAEPDAPVLVFIHGGYWRALDKSEHSFVARAFHERGVCVVVPNYALCPGTPGRPIGIADIALQMAHALEWTWRNIATYGGDPSRITVAGHSAGGHLAAMMLGCDWKAVAPDLPVDLVRNALSISGLHDLRPIQHTPFLASVLNLTDADSLRVSPALWPAPKRGKLYTVAGGDESAEFLRQNELIREAWGTGVVPVCEALPGLHHFSVLETLADPAQRLHALAMDLIRA